MASCGCLVIRAWGGSWMRYQRIGAVAQETLFLAELFRIACARPIFAWMAQQLVEAGAEQPVVEQV